MGAGAEYVFGNVHHPSVCMFRNVQVMAGRRPRLLCCAERRPRQSEPEQGEVSVPEIPEADEALLDVEAGSDSGGGVIGVTGTAPMVTGSR